MASSSYSQDESIDSTENPTNILRKMRTRLPRFRCSRSITEGVPMPTKLDIRESSPSVAGRPRGGSPCRLCWRSQGSSCAGGATGGGFGNKKTWCSHSSKSKTKDKRKKRRPATQSGHTSIILSPSGVVGDSSELGGGVGSSESDADVEQRRADTIKRAPAGFLSLANSCSISGFAVDGEGGGGGGVGGCESAGEFGASLTSGPDADLEDNQDYDSDYLPFDCMDPDHEAPLPSDPEAIRRALANEKIERARLEKLLEDKEKLIGRLEKTLAIVTDKS